MNHKIEYAARNRKGDWIWACSCGAEFDDYEGWSKHSEYTET